MGILLAYFVWVVSTLAVIATAWIGVADSGVDRLHLQRATSIQRSFDASFMAEDDDDTAAAKATAGTRRAPSPARTRRGVAWRDGSRNLEPRVALRANPPPFDGH